MESIYGKTPQAFTKKGENRLKIILNNLKQSQIIYNYKLKIDNDDNFEKSDYVFDEILNHYDEYSKYFQEKGFEVSEQITINQEEAIKNAISHSKGKTSNLEIKILPKMIIFEITDNGKYFKELRNKIKWENKYFTQLEESEIKRNYCGYGQGNNFIGMHSDYIYVNEKKGTLYLGILINSRFN